MMWDWGWSWGMGLMMISGTIITIGIIALVIWLIIKATRQEPSYRSKSDALEIAKERYARGEISKADFDQIKKDLI